MLKQIGRKLALGVILAAAVTPAAFAGNGSPTGTDPDPGTVPPHAIHVVLELLGLA